MHVANSRSKDINSGGVDELSSFLRCGEVPKFVAHAFVDFRTATNMAYLSLREN